MQKQLQQIIGLLPEVNVIGTTDKIITDVTADSRVVQPGSLFIALKGVHADGHKFLGKAAEAGATAALVEDVPAEIPDGLTLLQVNRLRTLVRQAELAGYRAFRGYDGRVSRPDVMLAMNRLSSLCWIWMIRLKAGLVEREGVPPCSL